MNKNQSFSRSIKKFLCEKTLEDFGLNIKGKEKCDEESVKSFFSALNLYYDKDENGKCRLSSEISEFLELCAFSFIHFLDLETNVTKKDDRFFLEIETENNNYSVQKLENLDFKNEKATRIFVRTMFILGGTCLDPMKGYHLSFSHKNIEYLEFVSKVLESAGLVGKYQFNNGINFLYFKNSEIVSDVLSYMGAGKFSMELLVAKAEKSVRNNINRKQNFDDANIKRSVIKAQKVIFDIKYLREIGQFMHLQETLRTAAEIREKNPEASMKELCQIFPEQITKSGLNHRLNKISSIADEFRRKENG